MSENGHHDQYERLLGEIGEGVRLHYDGVEEDLDLALLRGDHLYATGLSRLAGLGDLKAIRRLADAISEVAQAQASFDPDGGRRAWEAGASAVRGTGTRAGPGKARQE